MKKAYRTISLVELSVTLAVIVLITSVALNHYADVVQKSKLATNLANIQAVYNASSTFGAEDLKVLPNKPDSLIDFGTSSTLQTTLLNQGIAGDFSIQTLNNIATILNGTSGSFDGDDVIDELRSRGLDDVLDQNATLTHATFDIGNLRTLGDGSSDELLTFTANGSRLDGMLGFSYDPAPSNSVLICLGINSNASLIGTSGLNFAPTYYPNLPLANNTFAVDIERNYFRFINIYEIRAFFPTLSEDYMTVRLIATVHPNEFNTTNDLPLVSMATDFERLTKLNN